MAVYSTNNLLAGSQQACSGTYKTAIALTAATATLTSGKIIDVDFGAAGTPADNYMEYDISRQTAAGTSSAATPNALDPTVRAAGTVGSVNFTAEGTVTAASSVLYIPVNQRASYRWVAVPGSELVIPNVNLDGFAIRFRSGSYTGNVGITAFHTE
jgi:hypothetical protein